MFQNDFRLITLGRIALVTSGGVQEDSLAKRRRKLALLAVLALATRPLERDFLVEMFWGEQSEERARHSLSDALSHLRRVLGPDAITSRRTDVSLSDGIRLAVDATELAAAVGRKDWTAAVDLYAGPFLDCVHVESSASFEQWAAGERRRMQSLFVHACAEQCLAYARSRKWDACAALASRWLDAEPLSADAALYLLNALKAPGTRAADGRALAAYEQLTARLEREYHAAPEASVSALAADTSHRLTAGAPETPAASTPRPPSAPAPGVRNAQSAPPPPPPPPRRRRRRAGAWLGITAAVVALGAVAIAFVAAHTGSGGTHLVKPAIAVVSIRNRTGDTATSWLSNGLPDMIVADLSRSSAVDVVDPGRVMEVLRRAKFRDADTLSLHIARNLARRVGASWVVNGTLSRGGNGFILDFSVHDVASGELVRLYTVSASNVLTLADRAAARLLGAADAHGAGPRLAEVETSSLAAYQHYVRAMQAGEDGRDMDERRELNAAIALDSGFVAALRVRMSMPSRDGENDSDTLAVLAAAFRRAGNRVSDHDRLEMAVYTALHNGERARSEALGRQLVQHYPRDPHSYAMLADVYVTHGMWAAADTVLLRELALDSLAAEAGRGPCAPCVAFRGLLNNRATEGDLAGAEHTARRWIALQPDLPAAWTGLATILSYAQRFDEALAAERHAVSLSGNDPEYVIRVGRILLMARRWHEADSVIALWSRSPSRTLQSGAFDLRVLLQRERGQFRAANRTIEALLPSFPDATSLRLEEGNNFSRLGEYAEAARLYESLARERLPRAPAFSPIIALTGDWARAFCWDHALEADALAGRGDTVRLGVLADSIQRVSARSYYGRDWRLAAHVRGLIALHGQRYAEA
ncbi:MAG TPA: BTAD domain-containing putative transcriptional regulator, partial [Gemmatimonadaceae bacterium]|nr:BTAD domain-containing putative transcriptional regulator [Gemmatimonadaceae bacterium]